jgi:uncharacterized damage-inducible protein DinB
MRRSIFVLLAAAAAAPLGAQQQQGIAPNASVASVKAVWNIPHGFVVRALEQVPDSLLSFKPTPDVRSLGQLFAHVSDGENLFCALALGEPQPNPFDPNEKSKKTKAELLQALKESAAHCEKAYAQTDAQAQTPASFFGQAGTRMFLLSMNAAHDYEHYGNIVTYLRLKGIVPPSSQR